MGHYLSEMMDEPRRDAFNYQAVNELGFKSGYDAHLKMCPRCFSVVPGEFAERHWWGQHQEIAYFIWTEALGEPWRLSLGSGEDGAAFYANRNQDEIVFEQAVDK